MFVFRTFSALFKIFLCYQGRRVPLRFTLVPCYYISRLWRWPFAPGYYISRLRLWAFDLAFIFAPLALHSDFLCKAGVAFQGLISLQGHTRPCSQVQSQANTRSEERRVGK